MPALSSWRGGDSLAVDVDLDLVGDPALDAHVHETELGIDQVHVVVQALALAPGDLDAMGLELLRTWKLMQGSTASMKQTIPSVMPSSAAMDLARSSFIWVRLRVFT